ncbi:nucleotide exchange factor GrpE [Buchnera aphidicola (Neophyllaphis podocarpi)]|uniref:nucleotide exchange factor GrpE n=1 Tax=Buchnera aphidicola TaxID=9 RepID=UPI0031B88A81
MQNKNHQTYNQIHEVNKKKIYLSNLRKQLFVLENKFNKIVIEAEKNIINIKNRLQKDVEKVYKFSLEKEVKCLLPIIDSLESALEIEKKSKDNSNELILKIKNLLNYLMNILSKFNVTVISDNNIPFNPEIHQAVSVQYNKNLKNNSIIMIMQNGYKLNDRLLRPAMVIVSKKNY